MLAWIVFVNNVEITELSYLQNNSAFDVFKRKLAIG